MENQGQGRGRFTRRLTQNEVEQQIILFPFVAVAAYFTFEQGEAFYMNVKDSLGKEWTFKGKFHTNEEAGNYVSIGMAQFFMEKGLKANDEVTFVERPQLEWPGPWKKFRIELKRQIRLFGVDMWGELNV
ncbi:hypothetical protein GQ457_01G054110 [Hibiscus cannabinus]